MSKIVSFPLLNLSESCNQLKEPREVWGELSLVLKTPRPSGGELSMVLKLHRCFGTTARTLRGPECQSTR